MVKITLTAINAYPIINPLAKGVFGGLETHAWTIAQWLSEQENIDVRFVVSHGMINNPYLKDNIKVVPLLRFMQQVRYMLSEHMDIFYRYPFVKIKKWSWKLPYWVLILVLTKPIRHFESSPMVPHQLYVSCDSDVFLAFGVNTTAATIIASAKKIKKPVILFLESDSDLDENYKPGSKYVNINDEKGDACFYTIKHADVIITQKEEQKNLLRERFGRESLVIYNPIDLKHWREKAVQHEIALRKLLSTTFDDRLPERFVLWIGRAETFHKRADLMLDIACKSPGVPILMVMNSHTKEVEDRILQNKPENLYIINKVPFDFMPALFNRARCFVSTSSQHYEGFPNVFVQAAVSGVLVLSLETVPHYLATTGFGHCFHQDVHALLKHLHNFWRDDVNTSPKQQSIELACEIHAMPKIGKQILEVIYNVLSKQMQRV